MAQVYAVETADGDGELIFRQAEIFCQQFPSKRNSAVFEIIAKRKVAEHFKKCVVAYIIAHAVKVIMFTAGAHAFLRSCRSGVVAGFVAGSYLSAGYAVNLPEILLKRAFGGLMIVMGVIYILTAR